MAFGQLVVGPPGAGKTTYCYGLQQFFTALKRPITIVNLDPASPNPPYKADVSISDLITLKDAMDQYGLGPNGGMLYCLEYLEANFDWLVQELEAHLPSTAKGKGKARANEGYFVFDLPGQVELSTDHMSLRRVITRLEKHGFRLAAVHLTDAHHITEPSKYVSVLLLALRTMLQLELPHINVLSKIDLLASSYGGSDLPFNLDYYTEVQDLDFLRDLLDEEVNTSVSQKMAKKLAGLNGAICDLVEDYGLVGFETLAVEDKVSMANLVKAVDKALGYVPPPTAEHAHSHTDGEEAHQHHQDLTNPLGKLSSSRGLDLQERWISHRDEWDAFERHGWAKENELAHHPASSTEPESSSNHDAPT